MNRRWGFGGVAVGIAVTLGVVAIDGVAQDRDMVNQVRQPATVKYPDGFTHVAALWSVRSFVVKRRRPYELSVGSNLTYAHRVGLDVSGSGGPPVIASATWDARGVLIRLRSGHEVFVPARYFLYGR
jgi:hypothetical protein